MLITKMLMKVVGLQQARVRVQRQNKLESVKSTAASVSHLYRLLATNAKMREKI